MDRRSGQENKLSNNLKELKVKEKTEPIASLLEMQLLKLAPGYAKVKMKLKPEYQNFNGLVFGGIIMAIADQVFAYASNSLAYPSYASQFNIHFISSAGIDDELTAVGRVIRSGRRAGVSEMVVTNQDKKLIAKATGTTIHIEKISGADV
ncbi:PaaI family thioesterase [Chloroflexota bacterium]